MIKNDSWGKSKILAILEKRVEPLEIFARMVLAVHNDHKLEDDLRAKKKERAILIEEIR